MSKRRVYHVTPDGDGDWKVKERGAERAVKVLEDKSDALDLAKDLAKKADLGQVIVHGKDGVIQTEYTYGKDPEKTEG
jgi:hypothetical protein